MKPENVSSPQFFQFIFIQYRDHSPGEFHHSFVLEITQHPGDHLPVRTKVIRDGLVGDLKPGSILDRGFLQKKLRDTFIKAFPQDLLDRRNGRP